jgi:hypothetical protein
MTERRRLSDRRRNESYDQRHGNHLFHVTVGYYPDDNTPGEVFLDSYGAKAGSELEAYAHDLAILFSLGLQYSVPIDTIAHALLREADGSPSTIIGAVADRLMREGSKP